MNNGLPADWAIAKAKQLSGLPESKATIPHSVMAFAKLIELSQEMLVAFAEGPEWTAEQSDAYVNLAEYLGHVG